MNADTDATVTRKVLFDVSVGGQPIGKIVLGLFGNTAPKTVTNFVSLAGNEVSLLEICLQKNPKFEIFPIIHYILAYPLFSNDS